MILLALEFSSPLRSVAILDDSRELALVTEPRKAKTGMQLIEEAIQQANLEPWAITRLAIGIGPGSCAGIRSAIAIAQGWQLARETPTVGIRSMESLAETARSQGLRGEWSLVVDAQRNELYQARYSIADDRVVELDSLRIIGASSLEREANLLGPEANRFSKRGTNLHPSASELARLAFRRTPQEASSIEPVYLRETAFVKAPPARAY